MRKRTKKAGVRCAWDTRTRALTSHASRRSDVRHARGHTEGGATWHVRACACSMHDTRNTHVRGTHTLVVVPFCFGSDGVQAARGREMLGRGPWREPFRSRVVMAPGADGRHQTPVLGLAAARPACGLRLYALGGATGAPSRRLTSSADLVGGEGRGGCFLGLGRG